MIGTTEMLLVADGPIASGLAGKLAAGRCVCCRDPYDALLKMSRRRWATVVLAAGPVGFAGLCKASRRLQRDARLYALCTPAGEPQVRPLAGRVLDDYFIYPPTDSEIRRMSTVPAAPIARPVKALPAARPTRPAAPPASTPTAGVSWAIEPRELAKIISAARTSAGLAAYLAKLVSARIGVEAQWMDLAQAPADRRPLLLAVDDIPRVLVPAGPHARIDEATTAMLDGLQQCLPALLANAGRAESLHRLAVTDYLTGAYNRRYFYHLTDQILDRGRGRNFRVAMLLFDIDDFKRYNDTYGHAAGDEILREVARLIHQTTREQDIVARIGGDEFTVLFWDNAGPRQQGSELPATAQIMADRFCQRLARHEFPCLGAEASGVLTISGGLATFPAGGSSCRELLRTADRALRAAKQAGKNAIHLIGD